MKIRTKSFFYCFLLISSLSATIEAFELRSISYEPMEYRLGERVRLQVELFESIEGGSQLGSGDSSSQKLNTNSVPAVQNDLFDELSISTTVGLPSNLDFHIYQVSIFQAQHVRSYIVEIEYALYQMELNSLPSFTVEGFTIPSISVPKPISSFAKNAENLADDAEAAESNLRENKQQASLESNPLSLPWVDLSMALLLQVIVLLPIVVFQVTKRLRTRLHALLDNYHQRRPYRQFLRQLHLLVRQKHTVPEHYRIISSKIRHYLTNRTSYPCAAYTTEELAQLDLAQLLSERGRPINLEGEQMKLWEQVLGILKYSDDCRFRNIALQGRENTTLDLVLTPQKKGEEIQILQKFAKLVELQLGKQRRKKGGTHA